MISRSLSLFFKMVDRVLFGISDQSALRRPEIRTFIWKIAFCIACMTMTSRTSACITTKKMGTLFNTVTFDEREFSVYFIAI